MRRLTSSITRKRGTKPSMIAYALPDVWIADEAAQAPMKQRRLAD
jgi:hypothetical protein